VPPHPRPPSRRARGGTVTAATPADVAALLAAPPAPAPVDGGYGGYSCDGGGGNAYGYTTADEMCGRDAEIAFLDAAAAGASAAAPPPGVQLPLPQQQCAIAAPPPFAESWMPTGDGPLAACYHSYRLEPHDN
jgi:hypothetical protein